MVIYSRIILLIVLLLILTKIDVMAGDYLILVENTSEFNIKLLLHSKVYPNVIINSNESVSLSTNNSSVDIVVQIDKGRGWTVSADLLKNNENHLYIYYDGKVKLNGKLLTGIEEEVSDSSCKTSVAWAHKMVKLGNKDFKDTVLGKQFITNEYY